eukprot:3796546-Prymnesium_polylepis.1
MSSSISVRIAWACSSWPSSISTPASRCRIIRASSTARASPRPSRCSCCASASIPQVTSAQSSKRRSTTSRGGEGSAPEEHAASLAESSRRLW